VLCWAQMFVLGWMVVLRLRFGCNCGWLSAERARQMIAALLGTAKQSNGHTGRLQCSQRMHVCQGNSAVGPVLQEADECSTSHG
jgi:hypothetical protein